MLNKKGSYIMEAAVVLPVIILTVITCILIIMFFYSQIYERCILHIELRKEAGKLTEKTVYTYDIKATSVDDREIYIRKSGFGGTVHGKKYLIMQFQGVLTRKGVFAVEGSSYATDASKFVRCCNFVKGIKDEE